MIRMKQLSALLLMGLTSLVISGCASTTKSEVPEQNPANNVFDSLLTQYKQNAENVSYQEFWNVYLQADNSSDSWQKHQDFVALETRIQNQEIGCETIDWTVETEKNFWSLRPHFAAMECYQTQGNEAKAAYHEQTIQYILSGMTDVNNGQDYYSSIHVASEGDAEDFLQIMGYEVLFTRYEMVYGDGGMYLVYTVKEPDSTMKQDIWFDLQEMIYVAFGINPPFAPYFSLFSEEYLKPQLNNSVIAIVANADVDAYYGNYDIAADGYLEAISYGSTVAKHRLGELCLQRDLTKVDKASCLDFLMEAAEEGYVHSTISLAYAASQGIGMERDLDMAESLINTLDGQYDLGEAWYQLYRFSMFKALTPEDKRSVENDVELIYQVNLFKHDTPTEIKDITLMYLEKAEQHDHELAMLFRDVQVATDGQRKDKPAQVLKSLMEVIVTWKNTDMSSLSDVRAKILLHSFSMGMKIKAAQFAIKENNLEVLKNLSVDIGQHAQSLVDVAHPAAYFALANFQQWYMKVKPTENNAESRTAVENLHYNTAINHFKPAQIALIKELEQQKGSRELLASWYSVCANQRDARCNNKMGIMFEQGDGTEKDIEQAKYYYQQAADLGYRYGYYNLAQLYENNGSAYYDEDKASAHYLLAAEKGHAGAQVSVGYRYGQGLGFEQSDEKAVEWYLKSAEQGNSTAQANLGYVFLKGKGVEKDSIAAVNWFNKARENGSLRAYGWLGRIYLYGMGVEKDEALAFNYLKTAYEDKNSVSWIVTDLAYAYMHGAGTEKNEEKACELYKYAAHSEFQDGPYMMGQLMEQGKCGYSINPTKALAWYRKGVAANDGKSEARIKEMTETMKAD